MRRVRTLRTLAVIAIALAALACKKVNEIPLDTRTPVPPPATLLVELSLPTLDGGLDGVAAYANRVQPGMGLVFVGKAREVFADAAGVPSLDGAKGDAPARLLVLDPGQGTDLNAVLVGVADEGKLRQVARLAAIRVQDGHALLGPKAAVDALAPYAFATLAKKAPPAVPAAIAYPAAILVAGADELKKARAEIAGKPMAELLTAYLDGVLVVLESSQAIELRVEASSEIASLELALVPEPGGLLAEVVKGQEPHASDLLARLPAPVTPPIVVGFGSVHLGPVRDELVRAFVDLFVESMGADSTPDGRAAFADFVDTLGSEMAMVGGWGASGIHLVQLVRVSDRAKAPERLQTVFARLLGEKPFRAKNFEIESIITPVPDAGRHDGVRLMGYVTALDPATLPPEQAAVAAAGKVHTTVGVWDDVLGLVTGGDASAARAVIDASRGKSDRLVLSPEWTRLAEDSRARGESSVVLLDLAAIVRLMAGKPAAATTKTAVALALGFQGGRARVRVAVPAAHVVDVRSSL